MTREEQLACLKDRPCDVCKMRTDKGCNSWKCVFEQTPDEEKETCEDCITLRLEKGTLKYSDKDYVVYKKEWLKKWWQPELALLGIELPSIQSTTKENLVEDCISRAELLKAVDTWDKFGCDADTKLVPVKDCYVPYIHYDDVVKAIKGIPSIQPKSKTGHWISKHIVDDCNGVVTWYECSECGRSIDETITEEFMLKDYPYCHCGAKMLPTDSEKE